MRHLNYHWYMIPMLLSAIFSLRSLGLRWPKPFKIISIFLLVTLIIEVFAIAWEWKLHKYWHYNGYNLWIYNIAVPIRYTLLWLFFYQIMESDIIKSLIRWFIIFFIILAFIDYAFIQMPNNANTISLITANIITVLVSLSFFRQLLQSPRITRLTSNPLVWISLGVFIYHSGSLPFFISLNYIIVDPVRRTSFLHINQALNIIMYSLFLIAFLCKPYPRK